MSIDDELRLMFVQPRIPTRLIAPIEQRLLEGLGVVVETHDESTVGVGSSVGYGNADLELESVKNVVGELWGLDPSHERPAWIDSLMSAIQEVADDDPEQGFAIPADAVGVDVPSIIQGMAARARRYEPDSSNHTFDVVYAAIGPIHAPSWVEYNVTRVTPDRQIRTDVLRAPQAQAAAEDLVVALEPRVRPDGVTAGECLDRAYLSALEATR